MKTISLIILFLFFYHLQAQNQLSDQELKEKLDSILIEGDLLYKFEKSACLSRDLAKKKRNIKKNYGGYLVYQIKDTIKTIILNKDKDECICEFAFIQNFNKPFKEIPNKRPITEFEKNLIIINTKIFNEIVIGNKYKVKCPEDYNINFILMPIDNGYKFYIITGTTISHVIPFGNDYVFITDEEGEIISWRKFHSVLIPCMTQYKEEKVEETIHSHLTSEPFITATDICTFKLYGQIDGQVKFSVLSIALSKIFTYDLKKNKITIEDAP